jgi:hypothetical protein
MTRLRTVCLVTLLATLNACGPESFNSESRLSHDFGNLSRNEDTPHQPCTITEPALLPKATRYVREIFEYMAGANSGTFKGELAPDKFCVEVEPKDKVNAFAWARTRRILFLTGLLERLENDAQIGGVMAHEMAHVSMRHDVVRAAPGVDSIAWRKVHDDIEKTSEELIALGRELDGHELVIDKVLDPAVDKWLDKKERIQGVEKAFVTYFEWRSHPQRRSALYALPQGDLTLMQSDEGSSRLDATVDHSKDMAKFTARELLMLNEDQIAEQQESDKEVVALQASLVRAITELRAGVGSLLTEDERNSYRKTFAQMAPIEQKSFELMKIEDALRIKMEDLERGLPEGVAQNWKEQEADEVGLEIHLRSELDLLDYRWLSSPSRESLMNMPVDGMGAKGCKIDSEPSRGIKSHPAACWRIWNTVIKEQQAHSAEYAPLLRNAVKRDLPLSVSLTEVKQEITEFKLRQGSKAEARQEPDLAP